MLFITTTNVKSHSIKEQYHMKLSTLAYAGVASIALFTTQTASAGFVEYVIRGTPTIQANNVYQPGATEVITSVGGQKVGIGSSDIDGSTLGSLASVKI